MWWCWNINMVESVASNLGMLVNATDLLSFIFDVIQADGKDYGPFDPAPLPVTPSPPTSSPLPTTSPTPGPAIARVAPEPVVSGATWGDYLTPLSLSVALNMAYFTVSSFVNRTPRKTLAFEPLI
jgi:hypothetical protein